MIYIIGIGVEGRTSLSRRALKLIEGAGMLIGGRRHLACFPEFKREKVVIGSNLDEVAKILNPKSKIRNPKSAVVLASGDPNFFGIADFIIKRLGKDAVEIIPNVSTMQYAFAKIKENWNDARFFSLHGRGKVRSQKDIIDEIACHNKVGIFTDPDNTPSKIARALIDKGIKDYKVYVCEDLGTDNEKITEGTLGRIAKKSFSPLNVMMLLMGQVSGVRSQNLSCPGSFGIPDTEFSHSKGMITKEEIRVISLAKLKLKADSILWDIGAGSGSLSIEAAMLAKDGKVFAVEKEKERVIHIEKNKNKFKTANLEIIRKKAPDGFKNLPVPDAVFIGGGGRDIGKILEVCSKRIKRYGRIVVNAITIETLAAAAHFFETSGWNMETVSVNIAKTKDVADSHLFNAHNPVFIIVGEKP
ncbi:MAG: precorrin-6y C5,15-methyltransferase (decarboxylating) subunit CbiE [Deltaproteobacteria bacterium]|nr:precorrin-6y C5,15-methyltransferase (decarboxylating) subunit CbiE [Deltaproteobacteria bacterium]